MNFNIHPTAIIEGNVKLGKNVIISPFCYIGYSYSKARGKYYRKTFEERNKKNKITYIGNDTFIGPNVIIGEGTKIGSHCLIEQNTFIGEDAEIGDHTFIRYGCQIYRHVKIGNECIISGFICNNTKIGNNVEFFGKCIHRYLGREIGVNEPAPIIEDKVFVGFNALIIGGIRIGEGSIIKVGAIVTKNLGNNEIVNAGERR
ncbi:MAG: hypothetical protein DRG69_04110 [Deltaproteobacteria bacterium]|nr:MAG: hypothetical protein DRG69_04110 [Deltaproteobacteria bacterium]HHD83135.1 hypothetical protein [Bacteroidota bacterium]